MSRYHCPICGHTWYFGNDKCECEVNKSIVDDGLKVASALEFTGPLSDSTGIPAGCIFIIVVLLIVVIPLVLANMK